MKRKQIFDVGFQPYCSVSGSEGDSAQQYKKNSTRAERKRVDE